MRNFIKRALLGTVIAAVLALSFFGYLRPAFVVDLANRIILCL